MTLEGWVKQHLQNMYPTCWTFIAPIDLSVIATDHMQDVKGQLPSYIGTNPQLIQYFVNRITKILDISPVAIACFDKSSPDVKKMVCHEKRYERRCKHCQTMPDLPTGRTADDSYFHANCDKGCKNNQILWFEEGPYLSDGPLDPRISADWMKFASDSRNLYFELYPRIANALNHYIVPIGKMLFVSGLPFNTKVVSEVNHDFANGFIPTTSRRADLFTNRVVLDDWSLDREVLAAIDLELVNRVILFEGMGHGAVKSREVPEMYNTIHEADNSVFFFSQFFPQHFKQMAYINDGDAISIGMFRAIEDLRGPDSYMHEQWLCLPIRSSKLKTALNNKYKFQYLNLTKLCQEVESTVEFVAAGVQSPIATLIFLIILSETDFFKGEFCFGIGKEPKKKKEDGEEESERATCGIWDTFFSNLSMFSHLVQYYPNVKDTKIQRQVVIDRDLFRIFGQMCYTNKYGSACRKKGKDASWHSIKVHTSALKDKRKHAPDDNLLDRWCAQIDWNLNYWVNAWRNIYIDPFKQYEGKSVFGYIKIGASMSITNDISSKLEPVDEVYKRNFWKRRQKEAKIEPIPEKKKMAALDAIRGK